MGFWESIRGNKFVDVTMPRLAKAIEDLAAALKAKDVKAVVPLHKSDDPRDGLLCQLLSQHAKTHDTDNLRAILEKSRAESRNYEHIEQWDRIIDFLPLTRK